MALRRRRGNFLPADVLREGRVGTGFPRLGRWSALSGSRWLWRRPKRPGYRLCSRRTGWRRRSKDFPRASSSTRPERPGESVMMSLGGLLRAAKVASRQSTVQLITEHFLSSNSRMVWTWGRINCPLGAWRSWGITSKMRSPGWARLPVMERSQKSSGACRMISCRSWEMPSPVLALTAKHGQVTQLVGNGGLEGRDIC